MTKYLRVVPRDFFNEAKLLKCLGRLSLFILDSRDGIHRHLFEEYDHKPFDIRQTEDGDTFVLNYKVYFMRNKKQVRLYSFMNSKENYPLYFVNEDSESYDYVFDEEGDFTKEFLSYVKGQ